MGLVESGDVGITGEDETPGVADPIVFAGEWKEPGVKINCSSPCLGCQWNTKSIMMMILDSQIHIKQKMKLTQLSVAL